MAWWLHTTGHITRRQLRVYFALHEMHERRMFARQDEQGAKGKPSNAPAFYGVEELRPLTGRETQLAELRADVRALARLGLATLTEEAITFAASIEQVSLPTSRAGTAEEGDDPLDGFWTMLTAIPKANRRRTIPVPRRTLRALAGGFSRGTTAVMLAMLIRCLFRHAGAAGQGGRYRIDGRTKGSWIAETFGVSRRAVTEGRNRLIELGWLIPLDTPQIELNRWGTHDRLNPNWQPADAESSRPEAAQASGSNLPAPEAQIGAESASPISNQNTPYGTQNQNTRDGHAGPASGVSVKRVEGRGRHSRPPRLTDIQSSDLSSDARLIELHRQAVEAGRWGDAEADKLDFLALAERARAHASDPPRMFAWLITRNKRGFITQSDEDRAADRLRSIRNGPTGGQRSKTPPPPVQTAKPPAMSEEGKLIEACLKVARQRRMDPFHVLKRVKPDWTKDRWEQAVLDHEARIMQRHRDSVVATTPHQEGERGLTRIFG
ncbi:MAG: hypothetical protein AAF593_00595 [Planctomycetota bacterium]